MTLRTAKREPFHELPLSDFVQLVAPKSKDYQGPNSFLIPGTERKVSIREIANDPLRITKTPNLKVAYAQVKTEPGAFEENLRVHTEAMARAHERGAHLLQFPEMSLPHYCSLDLLLDRDYLKAQEAWLQEIVEFSKKTPELTTAVGYVDVDWERERAGGRPYNRNALAIIRDGEVLGVVHKKLLPNYAVFDEHRWYEPGTETKVFEINGTKVGFLICEDIWVKGYDVNPIEDLVNAGAEFLSHSQASPFHIGKNATRAELAQSITDTYGIPFGSVNAVGTFDGYEGDLPFDGRGIVRSADGQWLAMGAAYNEELLLLDPFRAAPDKIPELMPMQELILSVVDSMQSYFSRLDQVTGQTNCAVVGNSGGIDSAVIIALLHLAIGPDRIQAISLPTVINSEETKGDAQELAHNFGVSSREVSIQETYDSVKKLLSEAIELDPTTDNRVSQNAQARLRTLVLMAYSQALGGVMINTSNKTERFTNNFTIYADSSGAFGPIADVDKDRVYEMARYLNKVFEQMDGKPRIPQSIIDREASAELDFHQVDANVMGGKPEEIAPFIRTLIEQGLNSFPSMRAALPDSVTDELIKRWVGSIGASEWKGRQLPPGTRVTPVAAGFNRRIPINHRWRGQLPGGAA
ncbi:MAG: NAD(+) synthase [Bdellovibrionales bacterium]|nr:NAD(+) synthase [Bdellovibrionales bacterium]